MKNTIDIKANQKAIEDVANKIQQIKGALNNAIIGHKENIDILLTCIFCNGHALLIGATGIARSLTISNITKCLSLNMNRLTIDGNMDISDVVGRHYYHVDPITKETRFEFIEGPIFTNLFLVDNTEYSNSLQRNVLFEAMRTHKVRIGGKTFMLPNPFFLFITQDFIESENTQPLTAAQYDQFMVSANFSYPSAAEELEIYTKLLTEKEEEITFAGTFELKRVSELFNKIYVDPKVIVYARDLIRATREPEKYAINELRDSIKRGASTRAGEHLISVSRAHALLMGRAYVTPEDVRWSFIPVLRHRIELTYEAEVEDLEVTSVLVQIASRIEPV